MILDIQKPPKTALITGASKRIGRAICLALVDIGCKVVVHSRGPSDDLQNLLETIEQKGGKAVAVYGDLTLASDAENLIPSALERLGDPLDLLVNNASLFLYDDFDSASWDQFDRHMAIHVKSPMTLGKAFADHHRHRLKSQIKQSPPLLQSPTGGLIVNIIDQRVKRLNPSFATYSLSKSAQWTMTQTMAQHYAPLIRVNAIGPGPTLANSHQPKGSFEAECAAVPLGHGTSPQEIAQAILYLWASPSMTGQLLALDGGQHLAWKTPDYDFGGP